MTTVEAILYRILLTFIGVVMCFVSSIILIGAGIDFKEYLKFVLTDSLITTNCIIDWRKGMECDDWMCYDRVEKCRLFVNASNAGICGHQQTGIMLLIPILYDIYDGNCTKIQQKFSKQSSSKCFVNCHQLKYSLHDYNKSLFKMVAWILSSLIMFVLGYIMTCPKLIISNIMANSMCVLILCIIIGFVATFVDGMSMQEDLYRMYLKKG